MTKPFTPTKILLRQWADGQSLSIWHIAPACWTYCHTHDGHDNRVGSMFPTKTALMIDTPEYLTQWGN